MKILSLFDGMSGAQVAVQRAGIDVSEYHACEIDRYAIQITQKNFPRTIQHGSVVGYQPDFQPDILVGGSPCQGFSFAGKRLNFDDFRSKLFFEYVRILKESKPTYFLLENVRMSKTSEQVITQMLGVEPIEINSGLVSAQTRNRLYWTNIPFGVPIDKGILMRDILEYNPENYTIMSDRFVTRNANTGCLTDAKKPKARNLSSLEYVKNGRQGNYIACDSTGKILIAQAINGENCWRKLTCLECERLQTYPDNYSEGVSATQRYKMLGNSFTVDVIAAIFRGIIEPHDSTIQHTFDFYGNETTRTHTSIQ